MCSIYYIVILCNSSPVVRRHSRKVYMVVVYGIYGAAVNYTKRSLTDRKYYKTL